jgi:hypothetical protein
MKYSQAHDVSLEVRSVRIKRLSPIGGEWMARVTGVSEKHVQFTLDESLRVGEFLKAVVKERTLFGVVRSCERRDRRYEVDAELLYSITASQIYAVLREWGLRPSPFCLGRCEVEQLVTNGYIT